MQQSCLTTHLKPQNEIKITKRNFPSFYPHYLFQGLLQSYVQCTKCTTIYTQSNIFEDLQLEIDTAQTLESALTKFTSTELLDGDNCYNCQLCKHKTPANKNLKLTQIPAILTIQLKHFAFSPSPNQTNNSLKLNHHVQFPFTLPLSKYMAFTTIQNNISEPKLLYQLYGVIVHSGTSLEDGHYYSYIQSHKDLQWYKMNDKSIQQVHPNEVLAAKAYLLFYKQNKEASNNAPMSHFPNDFSCHKSSLHPQGKKSKPPKNPTNSASPNTTQQLYSSNLSNLNVQTSNEPKLQNIQVGNWKTAHSQWNIEKTYNKSSLKANKINTKSRRPLWSSVQKFQGHIERQTIQWEQHYKWNQKMLFEHSYRKKSLRKLKNATAKVHAELQF